MWGTLTRDSRFIFNRAIDERRHGCDQSRQGTPISSARKERSTPKFRCWSFGKTGASSGSRYCQSSYRWRCGVSVTGRDSCGNIEAKLAPGAMLLPLIGCQGISTTDVNSKANQTCYAGQSALATATPSIAKALKDLEPVSFERIRTCHDTVTAGVRQLSKRIAKPGQSGIAIRISRSAVTAHSTDLRRPASNPFALKSCRPPAQMLVPRSLVNFCDWLRTRQSVYCQHVRTLYRARPTDTKDVSRSISA